MSNTTEKAPRITKSMKFADIKAILSGEDQPNGIPIETLIEAMDKEMENLAKKNASGSKKPTAKDEANERYKAEILEILGGADTDENDNIEGMTCAEIHRLVNYDEPYEVQKTSSLLRLLGDKVRSEKGKGGKTLFFLA